MKFYNTIIGITCFILLLTIYLIKQETKVSNTTMVFSNFTGEPVSLQQYNNNIMQITYDNKNDKTMFKGISEADVIMEYCNDDARSIYKAIFHDNIPQIASPVSSSINIYNTYLPKLRFADIDKTKMINLNKPAKSIFVTFNDYASSNFIYKDGLYYHYKDINKDLDGNNYNSVAVANVIVQYTEEKYISDLASYSGKGKGIVFTKGKCENINWEKTSQSPIKISDKKNNSVYITPGSSWYIIVYKNASVAFG